MKVKTYTITPKLFKKNVAKNISVNKEKLIELIFKKEKIEEEIKECMFNIETYERYLDDNKN
jgi:hypothetical protein